MDELKDKIWAVVLGSVLGMGGLSGYSKVIAPAVQDAPVTAVDVSLIVQTALAEHVKEPHNEALTREDLEMVESKMLTALQPLSKKLEKYDDNLRDFYKERPVFANELLAAVADLRQTIQSYHRKPP